MTGVADDEPVSASGGVLPLGTGTAGADSEGSPLGVSLGSGVSVPGVSDGADSVWVGSVGVGSLGVGSVGVGSVGGGVGVSPSHTSAVFSSSYE